MASNFRNPMSTNEPPIFGGPYGMQTPVGTVRTNQPINSPPPLPPRPYVQQQQQNSYGNNYGYSGGSGGMYGSYMNSYGNSYGGLGSYGGYGGGYGGVYGMGMGGYNRFGGCVGNPMDPENRFIHIAEESSRPAFQSIESLVNAIGNIASMLDSTFFAITSSFRAILGVAANFGRLRSVFSQFLSTLAIVRGLSWLYRKILYTMKLSNIDPSIIVLNDAFSAAQNESSEFSFGDKKNNSNAWPILVFIGFIFTAPYIIMKLLGTVSSTALEETKNPTTWLNPIKSQAIYNFQSSNEHELNIRTGQILYVAPRDTQNVHKLLNTGWVLATTDNQHSGIVPVNYIKAIHNNKVHDIPINNNNVNNNIQENLTTNNNTEFTAAFENSQSNVNINDNSDNPIIPSIYQNSNLENIPESVLE